MVKDIMQSFLAKFIAWGTLVVLVYHLLGGIRHMFMDMGHFEELHSGNSSALFIMALTVVLAIVLGWWLW